MAHHVHRDLFRAQRRTVGDSDLHVFGETVLESVTAKKLACARREHRLFGLAGALGEPDTHDGNDAGRERGDPQLSSLAQATDMRSGAEMNIGTPKADQLGRPQACLGGKPE